MSEEQAAARSELLVAHHRDRDSASVEQPGKRARGARSHPVRLRHADGACAGRGAGPEALTPAVPIRRSVTDDYIVCLEDGKKLKMLKRHLMTAYGMTPGTIPGEVGLAWTTIRWWRRAMPGRVRSWRSGSVSAASRSTTAAVQAHGARRASRRRPEAVTIEVSVEVCVENASRCRAAGGRGSGEQFGFRRSEGSFPLKRWADPLRAEDGTVRSAITCRRRWSSRTVLGLPAPGRAIPQASGRIGRPYRPSRRSEIVVGSFEPEFGGGDVIEQCIQSTSSHERARARAALEQVRSNLAALAHGGLRSCILPHRPDDLLSPRRHSSRSRKPRWSRGQCGTTSPAPRPSAGGCGYCGAAKLRPAPASVGRRE